jgi:SAM-dependent methyltransferase
MPTPQPAPIDAVVPLLRDPESGARLEPGPDGSLREQGGARRHPIVDGIPWVLPEGSGIRPGAGPEPAGPRGRRAALRAARGLSRLLPSTTRNVGSERNFAHLARLLEGRGPHTHVLVVGGAIDGIGLDVLRRAPHVELLATDVVVGPETAVVCDAHALPFADGTFDAIVCQGVLGILCDPYRAVDEFHRVLAPDGLIYTEVPFLQGVHNGGLDFTRWTMSGHRRLLRRFSLVRDGAHNGPGMALAWQLQYFLMAFAGDSRIAHALLRRVGSLAAFWLTWLDPWLVRRAGGPDGAAGTFFLGRRSDETVDDAAIVAAYRGAVLPASDPRPA